MDIECKHAELIDLFVKQAAVLDGPALAGLVLEATSHPSLFAFSEILSVPDLAKLEVAPYSSSLDVLRLFAYGTWSDYKCNAASFPALSPDQVRKLKQLSVLTLAETNKTKDGTRGIYGDFKMHENVACQIGAKFHGKVLPYDQLMQEIDVSNVRELEDFLINECMYAGIVRGKLDQFSRCFEVQFAAGRDLRPEQLNNMIQTLANWLDMSDSLLHLIQDKIKWADTMSEATKKHHKEIEDRVEEVKKSLKADMDLRGHEEMFFEHGGMMDYEEDRVRPKRRRAPMP